MFKQLAVTFALAVLVLDSSSAHLADDASPSTQLLRSTDGGRVLEVESSTSTDGTLFNSLYEANTSIKGCHWYNYFMPWSCCGTNSC